MVYSPNGFTIFRTKKMPIVIVALLSKLDICKCRGYQVHPHSTTACVFYIIINLSFQVIAKRKMVFLTGNKRELFSFRLLLWLCYQSQTFVNPVANSLTLILPDACFFLSLLFLVYKLWLLENWVFESGLFALLSKIGLCNCRGYQFNPYSTSKLVFTLLSLLVFKLQLVENWVFDRKLFEKNFQLTIT